MPDVHIRHDPDPAVASALAALALGAGAADVTSDAGLTVARFDTAAGADTLTALLPQIVVVESHETVD